MSMIHDITAAAHRNKKSKRKGRGESSGKGKTCGRGNKGSKSRVGTYIKRGYEGGQTPIFRRFPKRGFSNDRFARDFYVLNISDLAGFADGTMVDAAALIDVGLIPDDKLPVKILGDGELKKKLTVAVEWYTQSAFKKIGDAGGTVQNAKGQPFEFPKPKKKFVPREAGKEGSKKAKEGKKEAAAAQAEPAAKAQDAPPTATPAAPAQ